VYFVFCPYCGSPMNEDHLYCMSCGKRVERITSPTTNTTPPSTKTTPPKSEIKPLQNKTTYQAPVQAETLNEYVVGGFSSADMARPGSLGYGIYITNKRVIGIKQPGQFAKAVGGAIAGAVMGAVLGFEAKWTVSSTLGKKLSNEENRVLLGELEKSKDIELNNQDITLIQLKETFLINPGQLAFFLKGAQKTDITISLATDEVVNSLKELFKEHFPKVLKVVI
jgi:hypothetical protein